MIKNTPIRSPTKSPPSVGKLPADFETSFLPARLSVVKVLGELAA